jgi:iron complex transport system substrate-binding protein
MFTKFGAVYRSLTVAIPVLVISLISPTIAHAAGLPHRIISLSPSATEDLFAIGARSQVIAVDDLSNFPATAPMTKLSAFTPNVEAIAAYQPDLVILNSTATAASSVRNQLASLGIAIYFEKTPTSLPDAYSEITDLGAATGHDQAATLLVKKMKREIASALTSVRQVKSKRFFHELDNTLYSATSTSFIGRVYQDFRLINVADKAAKADSGGYPQLQREFLIKANPEIIFLADAQYGQSMKTVSKRTGWSAIAAIKNHRVISLPADLASRWGPRLADFYLFIATSLKAAH